MSVPNEADFAIIKAGDGASPTEVFTAICGVENVQINKAVSATDKYRRDCAAPGNIPIRRNVVTGKSLTITASGAANVANVTSFEASLGVKKNYKIELYQYNGTSAGVLLGTYSGAFVMMSDNMTTDANANSSGELSLNNDGAWTYTAAP